MRIVMMGLLVGSALGVLAGTAASSYVSPGTQQVVQSYQNQANSDTRSWEI